MLRFITGEDLTLNLWDLSSGKRIKKMARHKASIYLLASSAESSLLVNGNAGWTMKCWDVKGAGGPPNKQPNEATINGFPSADANKDDIGSSETRVTLVSCLHSSALKTILP